MSSKEANARYKMKNPWFGHLYAARKRCRVKTENYHKKGIECFLTTEDIKFLWFRDKAHLQERPSIDRIDNSGNYTLENCRFVELTDNIRRGNIGRDLTPMWKGLKKYHREMGWIK